MIYRLCEHILGNVAQHAGAHHVYIHLQLNETEAVFRVEDDGQGFELPSDWLELARQGRYGLFGSRERAMAFGGEVDIRSAPGKGVSVQLTLPVAAWER